MAEKKTNKDTEIKTAETKAEEKAGVAETEKQTEDGGNEERVSVYVPRGRPNEDSNLFISVNGVNYLLPRGETSLVPPEIAEEYYRSVKATDEFYNAMDDRAKAAVSGTAEALGM